MIARPSFAAGGRLAHANRLLGTLLLHRLLGTLLLHLLLGAIPPSPTGVAFGSTSAAESAPAMAAAPPATPADAARPIDPIGTPRAADPVARLVLGVLGYARWPSGGPVIRLCIAGETARAGMLAALDGAAVAGRRNIASRVVAPDAATDGCDALYVGAIERAGWAALYAALGGAPVLTISEDRRDCVAGGVVCLVAVDDVELSFEINLDSAARSGVRIHPNVLQLGRRRGGPR